jgi:starvation-inducible outer membrane lipoprotein
MKKMHAMMLLGATSLLLAACSSSHDDAPAPEPAPVVTTEIPASATANAAGLTAFVNGQIAGTSDTAEPILVGDAVLPLDDSTETSL